MSTEREIKRLAPSALDAGLIRQACRSAGFGAGRARTGRQRDVYLDTSELDVLRSGAALRLRLGRGWRLLGWKAEGAVDRGVHVREIEIQWPSAAPPAAALALPDPIRHRVEPIALTRPLAAFARLEGIRTRLLLHHEPSNGRAELVIDRVRATVLDRPPVEFHEIEIEILSGAAEPWSQLASVLDARFGLEPSRSNKLRHAFGLAGVALPARDEPLDRARDLEDAAREVFRRHLDRALREEPACRLGLDPEAVHDMRVALRRLRAAFRTFEEAFAKGVLEPFDNQFRRTGLALGRVRDLDVLLAALPGHFRGMPKTLVPGIEGLVAGLLARRQAEIARLVAALASPARLAATERFRRFVRDGPKHRRRRRQTLGAAAPAILREAARRVSRRARDLGAVPAPADLHQLRIALKRLRYAAETFEPLYGPGLAKLVAMVKKFQDVLGAGQDAAVASASLGRWLAGAGRPDPIQVAARAVLLGQLARQEKSSARRFLAAWRTIGPEKLVKRVQSAIEG